MPILASNSTTSSSKVRELCPAGNHSAICFYVADLGLQRGEVFDKKLGKKIETISHKIVIAFELDERMQQEGALNGKRFVVSREFTLSLHEKSALRPVLESWRGAGFTAEEEKAFDVEKLVGVPCLVNIVHKDSDNGKTYANIGAISPLMKGMTPITIETDWSKELPEWIQNKINQQITGIEHYQQSPKTSDKSPSSEKSVSADTEPSTEEINTLFDVNSVPDTKAPW